MRRVIAHTFHEEEQSAANDLVTDKEVVTDSYIVGLATDEHIQDMEARGMFIEPLPAEGVPTSALESLPEVLGAGVGEIAPDAPVVSVPSEWVPDRLDYVIGVAGPISLERRQDLDDRGVRLAQSLAPDTYLAYVPAGSLSDVSSLDFITGVLPAEEAISVGRPSIVASAGPDVSITTFDVVCRADSNVSAVEALLRDTGFQIVGTAGRKIRFVAPSGDRGLETLRSRGDLVERLAEYVAPELHNDAARALIGLTNPGSQGPRRFQGEDQVVAVADTGFDANHLDFDGRIGAVIARGRPGDASDPHGHGTHVAGSVLGDGQRSNRQFAGSAPRATLVFQSLMGSDGKLTGLPIDLRELFQEAYDEGARIHNDSWGADIGAEYVIDADEADDFVKEHPDMLVVTSAGNDGAASGTNEPVGHVDLFSMGSLGGSKNVLTVGASRSDRVSGGISQLSYGKAFGVNVFPDPPIRDETVSGDSSRLAAFSSRGPLQTLRIKPDVVAPGTDVVSTKSSTARIEKFWGAHANSDYAYWGGTSMATPLVAGMAACVRQYFIEDRAHEPSAALLKGTIINGANRLTGTPNTPWHDSYPNPHQGFGLVHFPTTVPEHGEYQLEFVDTQDASGFTTSGQRRRFEIDVEAGQELRVCLTYADEPGRGCQNVLNLFVEDPDRKKVVGNAERHALAVSPDGFNNVEVVRIEHPDPGKYLILIQARNILFAPQGFALVATGLFGGGPIAEI